MLVEALLPSFFLRFLNQYLMIQQNCIFAFWNFVSKHLARAMDTLRVGSKGFTAAATCWMSCKRYPTSGLISFRRARILCRCSSLASRHPTFSGTFAGAGPLTTRSLKKLWFCTNCRAGWDFRLSTAIWTSYILMLKYPFRGLLTNRHSFKRHNMSLVARNWISATFQMNGIRIG